MSTESRKKKKAQELADLVVDEVALVGRPAIQRTFLEIKEAKDMAENDKAAWTTAYINNLPDAAFAYIAPGGELDDEGKTVPRTLRYLPHHNETVKDPDDNESVDIPHLRNALARVDQAALDEEAKKQAKDHLMKHAQVLLEAYKMTKEQKAAALQAFTEVKTLIDEEMLNVELASEVTEKEQSGAGDIAGNMKHIAELLSGIAEKLAPAQAATENKEDGASVHEASAIETKAAIAKLLDDYQAKLDNEDIDGASSILWQVTDMQWDLEDTQKVVAALAKGLKAEMAAEQKTAKAEQETVQKSADDALAEVKKQVKGLSETIEKMNARVEDLEKIPGISNAGKELGTATEENKPLFKGIL